MQCTQNHTFCCLLKDNLQPIHLAASHGHVQFVEALIDEYRIDPMVTTKVHLINFIGGEVYYILYCSYVIVIIICDPL